MLSALDIVEFEIPVKHSSRDVEWTVESGLQGEVASGRHQPIEYVKQLNWMSSPKERV